MSRMKRSRPGLIALAVIGAVVAAGCTGGSGSGDKSGGSGEPVVLRLAEGAIGGPTTPSIGYFIRRVAELSGGALRIETVPVGVNGDPEIEQQIVGDVAAGKLDLGPVGTRIFDTLGVKSLQALTAPMLIDSYALEQAVIASDIPGRMLAGLDRIGLVGLAVFGDGMRKPVAVRHPLLGPADWRGITFSVFRSQGEADAVRALGAQSTDIWGVPLSEVLVNGQVQGAENNLLVYQDNQRQSSTPYVTANVNLWPRTVALVANPRRLSGLSADRQAWLRQAAAEAAARSTGLFDHDGQIVAELCQAGARFANASEADLAGLREAFAPVYATLAQDPQTKAFIAQIEQLKQSTPAGPALVIPADCTGTSSVGPHTGDSLSGTWTTGKVTESEWVHAFIEAGGSEKEAHSSFRDASGSSQDRYWSWRFEDGYITLIWPDGSIGSGPSPYEIDADGTLIIRDDLCVHTYRFTINAETLRLHAMKLCSYVPDRPYGATLLGTFPMTKTRPSRA
jgi:TRAP-type C4-dicarboxylate transport system substrate-binding protein